MKYCRLLYLLLFFLCLTSCSTKQKMIRQMEKDERAIKKMERKQLKRAYRAYNKEYRAWYKLQTPDVKKRLKEQKRETKKFYKPYGKGCTNTTPGKYRRHRTNYREDGIK